MPYLDDTLYLYDLTSTYFEGQAKQNPQAKRGYARDKRPDCKQVVVGLVLDRDGFPKAHEIWRTRKTLSRFGGAGITTSWRGGKRKEMSGWMTLRMRRSGRR
jgi:hypothetical protein